jgi:hypothetical protein
MIDNEARLSKLKEARYQAVFGVKKPTFDKMASVLQNAYCALHKNGGKPSKLSVLDKLVITLMYYREYRTFEHIAFDYGVSKSTICESVKWVEQALIGDSAFALPSKRAFEQYNDNIEIIVVDVTEQEVERPKRGKNDTTPAKRNAIR